jgi:hypothetical protein
MRNKKWHWVRCTIATPGPDEMTPHQNMQNSPCIQPFSNPIIQKGPPVSGQPL